jgi:hypothetical protein
MPGLLADCKRNAGRENSTAGWPRCRDLIKYVVTLERVEIGDAEMIQTA